MRTSKPIAREARRGPMEVTYFQTTWTDLDGRAVVDERIVSLFFPNPEREPRRNRQPAATSPAAVGFDPGERLEPDRLNSRLRSWICSRVVLRPLAITT